MKKKRFNPTWRPLHNTSSVRLHISIGYITLRHFIPTATTRPENWERNEMTARVAFVFSDFDTSFSNGDRDEHIKVYEFLIMEREILRIYM